MTRRLPIALAAVATAALAGPAGAQAAANPYTPQRVCGPGYEVVRSETHSYGLGRAYLLRKPGTRKLCATTIKTKAVGKPTRVSTWLHSALHDVKDTGAFRYYAGPVKWTNTPGDCPAIFSSIDGNATVIARIGKGCG